MHFSNNKEVSEILERIESRNLPSLVYQKVSIDTFDNSDLLTEFKNPEVIKFQVGYISGDGSNPLDKIKFYFTKTDEIVKDDVLTTFSLLINKQFQENFYRIYES